MISNWVNIKKNYNIFFRGKIIWIDYQKDKVRIRKSTRLKYSRNSFLFVRKNIERYLEKNAEIDLKKEYLELEDERVISKIERLENKDKIEVIGVVENDLLVDNVLNGFYREKSFLKHSTLLYYKTIILAIKDFFKKRGIKIISDFKRDDCVFFMEFLLQRGMLASTIRIYFNFLGMVLSYALENNLIEKKHFFIPKMKLEICDNKICPFTFDEVKLILKNAVGDLRLYLYIAFFTGMRVGEILALNWADIDFENNEIKITKTLSVDGYIDTPKTKSSYRNVDILPILKNVLFSMRMTDSDKIFKVTRYSIRKNFMSLLAELGISSKHRLYDCRHTFASIMLSQGEEPMWVGCKMLGHKDLNETFKTYAKYLPKPVCERAKFLNNEFI